MLKGKVAVVTGGSRGIGKAAAEKLASLGADIAVVYRSEDAAAAEMCGELQQQGVKAEPIKLDVSSYDDAKAAVDKIMEDLGHIDILVNCAGITKDRLIAMMKEDGFDDVINVNLKGTFNMIKHCTPVFMKQRSGKIINLASVSGIIGNAGQVNYSASKAGIIGLTKSVAKELAGRGVCCNAVAPGFIETEMTAGLSKNNKLVDQIPMKRMGQPEEVAELIAFLASPASDYITGEVIKIDGGIAI